MLEWESVTVVWVIWATDVDVLPSDTSWLFEPTTGVHQFGEGSSTGLVAWPRRDDRARQPSRFF
jgi:hypothetical protein